MPRRWMLNHEGGLYRRADGVRWLAQMRSRMERLVTVRYLWSGSTSEQPTAPSRRSTIGRVRLVQFPAAGGLTGSYRSLLYLEQTKTRTRSQLHSWSGPEGIERYLAAEPKGRLIQSLKSYLSSRTLTGTEVFGRRQLSGGPGRPYSRRSAQACGELFRLLHHGCHCGPPCAFCRRRLCLPTTNSRWSVFAMHSQEPALPTWSLSSSPWPPPIITLPL